VARPRLELFLPRVFVSVKEVSTKSVSCCASRACGNAPTATTHRWGMFGFLDLDPDLEHSTYLQRVGSKAHKSSRPLFLPGKKSQTTLLFVWAYWDTEPGKSRIQILIESKSGWFAPRNVRRNDRLRFECETRAFVALNPRFSF
jgi:hypothetical protein